MTESARSFGQQRAFYGLALAALIGFVAYIGRGVIIPVVVAGFLSFFIYTLKETIRKGPLIGRFLPHWFCFILAFAAIGFIFVLIVDIIRDNAEALIARAPEYEARLAVLTKSGLEFIEGLGAVPEDVLGGMDELRSRALSVIRPVLAEIGSSLRSITSNVVTIFLYTVFMLIERGRIFKKINLLSGDAHGRRAVNETIGDIGAMVRGYITIKTVMNLAVAMISYAILRALGVEFAGFWGLLIFLLNYIPIVGSFTAITATVLFILVQPEGGGFNTALIALGLLVAGEQAMSSAVEPRLMGKSLNLSPLVILLSLSVWGTLWGFAGALLAVPITVTLMIVLSQFDSTRPIAILMSDSGRIADIRRPAAAP
jgi:predicted PurR-regulated permease PerM